jgi:NitT/TauT family transport system permease protein
MTIPISSVGPSSTEPAQRPAVIDAAQRVGAMIVRWLPALAVIVCLLLVWEWAGTTGRLPISVPAPSEIGTEFSESREMLWFHTAPTLSAAAKGYLAAAVTAFVLGMFVAFRPRFAGPVYQTSVIVSSVPLVALTPVLVLWLERGDTVRTTVAALAGFFPILVGCVQGFGNRDSGREELFFVLSADGRQRFTWLTLPASLPYLFAGLKAAAASAVLGAIIAEWSGGGGTRGLGQMMTNALFGFNVPRTWLTITTAAVLAVGAYAIVAVAERLVVRWDHGTTGVDL